MISYIEVASLDSGAYDLEILIPKSAFLPTKEYKTCVSFDLSVEFVSRSVRDTDTDKYEVIAIMPSKFDNLKTEHPMKIEVKFNREVDLDSLMGTYNGMHHICYLVSKDDNSKVINPHRVLNSEKDTLELYFDFKEVKLPTSGQLCYTLKCSTMITLKEEHIRDTEI